MRFAQRVNLVLVRWFANKLFASSSPVPDRFNVVANVPLKHQSIRGMIMKLNVQGESSKFAHIHSISPYYLSMIWHMINNVF